MFVPRWPGPRPAARGARWWLTRCGVREAWRRNCDRSRHLECRPHTDRPRPQGQPGGRRRLRAGRGGRPGGHRPVGRRGRRARRRHHGRVATGWRRDRPAHGRSPRPRGRLRSGRQPPLRGRTQRHRHRRRIDPCRHGQGGGGRRHREPELHAAGDEGLPGVERRVPPVDVGQPPVDARRPRLRHVDHRRREHRPHRRCHPGRGRRVGLYVPSPCRRRGGRRPVRRGDRARHGARTRWRDHRVRRRRAPTARHHHRAPGRAAGPAPRAPGRHRHRR